MSGRRPPRTPHESWVERQVREAIERGEFDDLPGEGKPIPGLDRPYTAERWAMDWARREGGDVSGLLSPMLLFRRERAGLLGSLASIPTEAALREVVSDFNHRLLQEYRRPVNGPFVPVGVLDVEQTVLAWREARPVPVPVVEPVAVPSGRRWWRRAVRWPTRRSEDVPEGGFGGDIGAFR